MYMAKEGSWIPKLTPYTKIKWIKDVNVRATTIKLLRWDSKSTSNQRGEKQGKKDKLDFTKMKIFTSKDTIKKVKNYSTG